MLQRFILPRADVGSGIKPASGAQLFFYEPGTSEFKDTFTDVNGLIASTNPVISDSKGVFNSIYLTGTYKVVLKDKNGSQIWEESAVQYDYSFDSASEAALVEFANSGASAISGFNDDGADAIDEFNANGEHAIDVFNQDGQEAITTALDSVLQSIDGVLTPGVNQDLGFITQPVTQIFDYGSLTG